MNISIFGLGYVGIVLAACLADNGNKVLGVDVNPTKVDIVKQGRSPIIEKGLNELVNKGLSSGNLDATTDTQKAVLQSDLSFVCVGTPSNGNGNIDLTYVKRVCEEIGAALAEKSSYHVVVLRSTMLPGSTEDLVIPTLEASSGKKAGEAFGVCFNPEFLREGSSIEDFYNPPFTIIGAEDQKAAQVLTNVYSMLTAPSFQIHIKEAEMVKYVNNAFHALKVAFANEIGSICKQQDIDSHTVMDIFCQDTKLNLSPYYLKPGFAFGGSCLPKDLRALLYHSSRLDVKTPVLESILPSNDIQISRATQIIKQLGHKRVGILGFSFKDGTDDLRESPMVELIEYLIGKGYQVQVYDRNVSLANLHGANRAYIEKEIPHISSLMTDSIDRILQSSEIIVIGNKSAEFKDVANRLQANQHLVDLVRITDGHHSLNGQYHGINW